MSKSEHLGPKHIIEGHMSDALSELAKGFNQQALSDAGNCANILLYLNGQGEKNSKNNNGDPLLIISEAHIAPETFDDFAILIEGKLRGASKFLQFYKQTGDESYRHLTKQEESHVSFFLDKAKSATKGSGQSDKIKQWKRQHDEIFAAVK